MLYNNPEHILLRFAATYTDAGTSKAVSNFRFGSPAVTAACSLPTYLQNPFSLDAESGNLTLSDYGSLKPSFDVESCQSFVVKVVGVGSPSIESTCSVTITVGNMNDSPYFSPPPVGKLFVQSRTICKEKVILTHVI